MRRLWSVRINAAARANGISYSKLIHGLKLGGVAVNRKMLADLAIRDPEAFTQVVPAVQDPAGSRCYLRLASRSFPPALVFDTSSSTPK